MNKTPGDWSWKPDKSVRKNLSHGEKVLRKIEEKNALAFDLKYSARLKAQQFRKAYGPEDAYT